MLAKSKPGWRKLTTLRTADPPGPRACTAAQNSEVRPTASAEVGIYRICNPAGLTGRPVVALEIPGWLVVRSLRGLR